MHSHNRDREKGLGQATQFNMSLGQNLSLTSGELSLLRSNSLKFQPQNMSCMPIMPQPFLQFFFQSTLHGKIAVFLKNIGRKNFTRFSSKYNTRSKYAGQSI
jgi:hypothetical protein